MFERIRKHAETIVVASLTAMVAAGGVAIAHDADGGGHDSFAHNAGKLGGKKPAFYKADWALVDADGSILKSSSGVSVVHGFIGGFYVTFPKNQRPRALSATGTWPNNNENVSARVRVCGGGPVGVNCDQQDNKKTVYVELNNHDGTRVDRAFYIVSHPSN
ncbi:MAG: hypothetical protein ACRDHV_00985 [Actinomycetota bacterium]